MKIVCFGEVLLRLSAPGRELLLQTGRLEAHVGGAEANVAVSLSQLGHQSAVVTALPDNSIGHSAVRELRRHGVDTSGVQLRDGRMGLYFLTHGAGERAADVLYDRNASVFALAPPETFDWTASLAGAGWLHVSGITPAVSAQGAASVLLAMTTAREQGVKVSFDCNYRAKLWSSRASEAPALFRRLCEQADLIFGEARDMAMILGDASAQASGNTTTAAANAATAAAGDGVIGNTSAAGTAFAAFPSLQWFAHTERTRPTSGDVQHLAGHLHERVGSHRSQPRALHDVVDRIGAGDAFAAGILHGVIHGWPGQRIVEFATAAASLKHTIPGDFNLVSASDVELLLSGTQRDVRR